MPLAEALGFRIQAIALFQKIHTFGVVMAHCLVTGSSGFIGRHLCRYLTAQGAHVTGLDMRQADGNERPQTHQFVQGNLATGDGLDTVSWDRFDVVFHLAAAGVKASARDWRDCVQVNLLGTLRLIDHLDQVERRPSLVYSHTYYEDYIATAPAFAENPYIMSKYAASQVVRQFARHYPGCVVMAKLFQTYGSGDALGNLIPYVVGCLEKGEAASLGSGAGLRDWVDVEDVAAGLVACWRAGVPGTIQAFDLGSGELVSIQDVLLRVVKLMGASALLLRFDASRDRGDVTAAGKAKRWPGKWRPHYTLAQGLERLIASRRSGEQQTKRE